MKKEYTYLVSYHVGAKIEKFIVKNHKEIPDSILLTMGDEKIIAQINMLYKIHGGTSSEKKYKTKLRKDSFVEIENITDLTTYIIELNFEENGDIENKRLESVEDNIRN